MSKYVTIFDYMDKILIVLRATSSGVSIISFISVEELDEELIEKFTVKLSEESDEESEEELTEVKICWNNKNKADWYDINKFKIILTTIDSNNFNHENKINKLKFNDNNSLINNIKNNTISEADAKKKINVLNEIKKAEIKNKRLINGKITTKFICWFIRSNF